MKILRFVSLVMVALTLIACSFTVNVPSIKTGETHEFDIKEPISDTKESQVKIEMGGGKLDISGGSDSLIEGTVFYNVDGWEPGITELSDGVLVSQSHTTNAGIPDGNIKNDWTLKLGKTPLSLTINAGAYEGTIDLSGLSIADLEINDGASKATIRFDSLNPVTMRRLQYKTGASEVKLLGLGNSNAREINFESGAGSYTLDFSGTVTQDISVKLSSGMSDVKVVVPTNVHTIVVINGGLANINANGTWSIDGARYEAGSSGPIITIDVEMALGNLSLSQK